MSSHAYSKLPYWRWWRHARKRVARRPQAAVKPWNGLVVAALLVAADALTKQYMTQLFPPHAVPATWLIGPVLILIVSTPLLFAPHIWLGAALGIAGTLGNMQSVLRDGAAPNPFMYASGEDIVAFNVADVCLLLGCILTIAGAIRLVFDRRQPHGA